MWTRHKHALLLAGWTALVWTTRIGNILGDDELSGAGRAGRLALAGSFTILAALVVWGVVAGSRWLHPVVRVLAAWTALVWVVRVPGIAFGGHDAAFVLVHLVLAVVSVVLAGRTRLDLRTAGRHRVGG